MPFVAAFISLISAVAGWYYLFYSPAAKNLSSIEDQSRNRRRQVLRRINGGCLFVVAVGLYAGFVSVDNTATPRAFVAVWSAVMLLLLVVMALVVVDLRLTAKLRRKRP